MKYHKLLLPFQKFHIPNYDLLPQNTAQHISKLNSDILNGKFRLTPNKCLCGNDTFDIIASIDKNQIYNPTVVCKKCGLVQTNPRYSETFYKEFYTNPNFHFIYPDQDIEKYTLSRLSPNTGLHILKAIEKNFPLTKNHKILEFGAGAGWNLIPFIAKGYNITGIDINPQFIKLAKKYNLPVELGDENSISEKYDIIILSHIFEHLPNPIETLLKLTDYITDNGIFYIEVPYIFSKKHFSLYIAHIYNFTPYSLKYFASIANLIPKKIAFLSENNFYGIFKKGLYKNEQLLPLNKKTVYKFLKRLSLLHKLKLEKKIKKLQNVPAYRLFYPPSQ